MDTSSRSSRGPMAAEVKPCVAPSEQGCGRVAGGASRSRSSPAAPTSLRCSVLRVRRRTRCAGYARSAQTPDDESEVEARCARGPRPLRSSPMKCWPPRSLRSLPPEGARPALRRLGAGSRRPAGHPPAALPATEEVGVEKNSLAPHRGRTSSHPFPKFGVSAKRRAGTAGRGACATPRSAGLAGRARSALQPLTRHPVFERRERSERSEFGDGPARPSTAGDPAQRGVALKPRPAVPDRRFARSDLRMTRKTTATGRKTTFDARCSFHASRVARSARGH